MSYENYTALREQDATLFGYGLERRTKEVLESIAWILDRGTFDALRVGDFGCADGAMLKQVLATFGPKVETAVGVDAQASLLPEPGDIGGAKFVQCHLWKEFPYPLADASRNVLIASAFFKHCPCPEKFLQECSRILEPGGFAILLDPRPGVIRLGMRFGYFERPYNPNPWSRRSMRRLLKDAGLEERLVGERFRYYWVAPTRRIYRLGLERIVPRFALPLVALHQSLILRRLGQDH